MTGRVPAGRLRQVNPVAYPSAPRCARWHPGYCRSDPAAAKDRPPGLASRQPVGREDEDRAPAASHVQDPLVTKKVQLVE